jgi:monoamine oxidase
MKTVFVILFALFALSGKAEAKSHCRSGQLYRPSQHVCLSAREFHRELGGRVHTARAAKVRHHSRHMRHAYREVPVQHAPVHRANPETYRTGPLPSVAHVAKSSPRVETAETEADVARLEEAQRTANKTPEEQATMRLHDKIMLEKVVPVVMDYDHRWAGSLYGSATGHLQ